MNDLRDGGVVIPDYQRDTDQWDDTTKSLFIESVINNLTIPAFFFEPTQQEGVELNEVVDGQQRLTTLHSFFLNKFRLVPRDSAPYLSPNSVHYANKTYDELPKAYQAAFKKYRLTIIKLRQLGDMRLEVFRRINQGGTPLSGQDIRLAYYGDKAPSVAFVRLVGIFDASRPASLRFLESSKTQFGLTLPWGESGLELWNDWWADKEIARGQTASESFLLGIAAAHSEQLDTLLRDAQALASINIRFNGAMNEALDACVAQLQYQDLHQSFPPLLMPLAEIKDKFFPYYERWLLELVARQAPNLPVTKNRMISQVIGSGYTIGLDTGTVSKAAWTGIAEFIRRPQEGAKAVGIEWPQSKGRWDGQKGYRAQFDAIRETLKKIVA